jgi:hypothetical protein
MTCGSARCDTEQRLLAGPRHGSAEPDLRSCLSTWPRQQHITDALTTINHLNVAQNPWIQVEGGEEGDGRPPARRRLLASPLPGYIAGIPGRPAANRSGTAEIPGRGRGNLRVTRCFNGLVFSGPCGTGRRLWRRSGARCRPAAARTRRKWSREAARNRRRLRGAFHSEPTS